MNRNSQVSNISWIATFFFAAIYAVLYHYPVVESDVFWQVRAGEEIFRTHTVQTVEAWSHTARGTSWYNFEWLPTLIDYGVSSLKSGYYYFPTLRSILVALFTLLSALFLLKIRPGVLLWVLIPLAHLLCIGRLQMRPELFVLQLYLLMLLVWLQDWSSIRQVGASLFILLLWSNFHEGLAPVGVGLFGIWVWLGLANLSLRNKLLVSVLGILTLFATPLGMRGFFELWRTLGSYPWNVTRNPDQLPFSINGASSVLFVAVTFSTLGIYFLGYVFRKKPLDSFPLLYRRPFFVLVATGFLLSLLVSKGRAQPYPSLFILPMFSCILRDGFQRVSQGVRPWLTNGLLSVLVLLVIVTQWTWAFDLHILPGFGINPFRYPVRTTEFIEKQKPPGLLFNDYDFGGYVIDRLREYPDSMDGRELQFLAFIRELNETERSETPGAYTSFFDRHGINLLLLKILPPPSSYSKVAPSSQWALVSFDQASVVYVRRTASNAALIAAHEYRWLNPMGDQKSVFETENRSTVRKELERCSNEPYCEWVKSNLH